VNTFPYFYDFENENTGSTLSNPTYVMVETGWLNAAGDDMDWTNDINATSSGSTGPNEDHTPAPGQIYMYLETSGSGTGRVANLETPTFDFTSAPAPQLSFWYHMYGATMGTMNLQVSTNSGTTWTTLWTRSGQQQTGSNDPWLQATVNIAAYGGQNNVQFRFQGISGTSFTGDMAIDDFLVENILPNNAGITAMVSPTLGVAAGNYSVDVTLQNFGSNALDSVMIEWEINGVAQTPLNYNGGPAVPAFNATNVNLSASTAFPSGLTNLKFWTSMPNGVADADNGNDTLNTIFCTGLAGVYTVGTATSDFATIADAEAALNGCGMAGPVTMQVQAGTYTPFTIQGTIPGLSATNTLTWDGSAQAAIIQATAGINILLDGADYVTIQDFTINNTSTTTSFGIMMTDEADFNTITGNRIVMSSTSFSSAGISSSASTTSATSGGINASNTLIENNVVRGGYRGITLYGSFTVADYNINNIIRNNDVEAFNSGIYTQYQDSIEIHGNYVHDMTSTFNYGIFVSSTMNSAITANRVIADDYGLYFSATNSRTTPRSRTLVANNMVIADGVRGVYFTTVRSTDFFHNTIRTTGTADAFVMTGIDNTFDIKNNVFYSEGGFAFESFNTTAILDMDYNVFYTGLGNSNSLIRYDGGYNSIIAWKTNNAFGYGQNSDEGAPRFLGLQDLHVEDALLENRGIQTHVLVDIDGDIRPRRGRVDIGADEYISLPNDAGVTKLISPTIPNNGGLFSVEIEVKNFGGVALSSFLVEWEINGVAQTPFPYTQTPIAPLKTESITLANINFVNNNVSSLKFWTTMPNGGIDEYVFNDTLKVDICPGLQGVYTVGQPTSDFPTVADAMNALNSCGITGPTEMQFQIGTYGPLVINKVAGTSATNTLIFNGVDPADATITHNATGVDGSATIALDGAEYTTIKNFTIESTGAAPAYGIILTNAADHNTIMDNNITVPYNAGITNVVGILASNSYTSSTSFGAAEGNNANYTTIEGNDISGGQAGIILEGGITDDENDGNRILNNVIHDADDWGIYVDEQDTFEISGNEVFDIQATTSDAIVCLDIHNFVISGNNVVSRDYGIQVDGGFSVIDRARGGRIYNNMVLGTGTAAEAMYLRDVDQIQIYHNTLVGAPGLYLDNHSNIDILNNIFSTANDYCLELQDATGVNVLDYNLYYVSGASGDVVRYNFTNFNTLNDWVTTGPPVGYDANSVSGNPNFVNGLHIGAALAEDAGTAGTAFVINEDFDGDARPMGTAPDIGADEAVIRANDAMSIGVISPSGCGNAAADVIIEVANVGTTTLLNVPYTVNVTGDATATYNDTALIMPAGQTFNYTVGTLNTTLGGTYNFEIIISAGTDTNPMNDTITATVVVNPDNENALTNAGDTIVCNGSVANLMVTSSVPNTSILWYDSAVAGTLINVGDSYTTPSAITGPTTFYVQLQGCDAPRKAITVIADLVGITVDLGADSATICSNGAVELIPTVTGSTATMTTWSNGSQATFLEATSTGTYSIMVMNENGCMDADTVEVLALARPNIANNVVNPNCGGANNGSIDLTLTGTPGPYNYAWSNSSTVEDQTGLAGGVYVVTVTDNTNGLSCSYVESFLLTEPTTLTTNVDVATTSCDGTDGTVQLTTNGGTSGYAYNWSNGATTEDLSGLPGGNYDVTVTDANGCTTTNSASVATTNPIVASVDTIFNEILDVEGAIEISATGGTGTLQYVWSTGATTQDLDSLNAGTYSVTIVDQATGCQTVLSGIVVEYQIPDMVTTIEGVNSIQVFPNPTQDRVFVNIELNTTTDVQLEVMNVTGQRLQAFTPSNALQQNYEIDLSDYPAGVYLARFIIGNEVTTAKIILSKN
jgi:hypothetical protein